MRPSNPAAIVCLLFAAAGCGGGASSSAPPPAQSSAAGDASAPPTTDPTFVIAGGASVTIAAGTSTSVGVPAWNIVNGDKLTYAWTLASKPAGSSAALASPASAQASLTPDLPGSYAASLVASDGKRLSVPAITAVTALDPAAFKGFVDLVNQGACNDLASDLFVVDGKYVFANVAGTCPDAGYSAGLYGLTPGAALCSVADSAAGPVRNCSDASVASLFDTIYAHRNTSDLGLGSGHTVSKFIKPAPVSGDASEVNFSIIDQGYSNTPSGMTASTAVVRDSADWAALWQSHKGSNAPALPPVDFGKKTVLALFYTQLGSCQATGFTRAYLLNGKLNVEYATRSTAAPDTACTTVASFAAELVAIDLAPDPSLAIVFRQTN